MGITFLALLLTQVDKILLSNLLTLTDYGYYTLAAIVAGSLYILISPITQAWFPRITELYAAQDYPALVRTYHQGAQLVTVVLGSAAVVLILFSNTFLHVWTQNHDLAQRTAPLLSLLVLGNLFNGLMHIPYQTQLAYGWTSLAVKVNIVSVLFIVPAIFWATPRYGAIGAAWVWVSLNAGYVLIGIHFMYHRILKNEKWCWYRQDVLYPLVAALVVSAIIRLVLPAPSGVLPQLATLGLASICTFTASVLAANTVRKRAWVILSAFLTFLTSKPLGRRV